jgi:hypothetical protein
MAWVYGFMAVAAIAWAAALLQIKRKNGSPMAALCLALAGSLVLSPRLYVYDWILAWPLLLAAWKYGDHRLRLAIAWAAPLFWIHDLFGKLHIPILTLVALAVFIWLMIRKDDSTASDSLITEN